MSRPRASPQSLSSTISDAFALHSGQEIVAETPELSLKSRQTTLDFIAGAKGAQRYKIYCTMMCFGMEHLNDLTIEVG